MKGRKVNRGRSRGRRGFDEAVVSSARDAVVVIDTELFFSLRC